MGSKSKFKILYDDLKSCGNNIDILFLEEEKENKDLNKISGFIIDQSYKRSKILDIFSRKYNKNIYSLDSWLCEYIQRYPAKLTSDYFIYENIINKNVTDIQFRVKRYNGNNFYYCSYFIIFSNSYYLCFLSIFRR